MNRRRFLTSAAVAAVAAAAAFGPAEAQSPAEFYKNKTVTFLVAAPAGGGYGANSRIVVKHLSKHIPGNPDIEIQFMSGAGGVKAANYLYNVAPKDGSWIGMPLSSVVAAQVLYPDQARFDAAKMNWLGTVAALNNVLSVWHTTPVKTWEDLKKQEVVIGTPSMNAWTAQEPQLMNHLLGTKIKLVAGYKGSNGVAVAIERGEVQGMEQAYASWVSRHKSWVTDNQLKFLIQVGAEKLPELPDVPLFVELVKSPREKRMVGFLHGTTDLGRSIYAPPGVPTDRVKALRQAVADLVKDEAFVKDMTSRGLPVNPKSGEEAQKVVEDIVSTPPDVVAELRQAFGIE